MVILKHPLLTHKYTTVLMETDFSYNAPHRFIVVPTPTLDDPTQKHATLANIHFQEGPIKECGVNGVCNEDLIGMVICRLNYFQESSFVCDENAEAIMHLEAALQALRKRTLAREARNVEGTHEV